MRLPTALAPESDSVKTLEALAATLQALVVTTRVALSILDRLQEPEG